MGILSIRKFIILLLAAIVTVSTVIAVTAYTSATVQNPMEFKIVSTDAAKLALSPGEVDYGEHVKVNVSEQDGVLELEFSFGSNNDEEFTYTDVFRITNNSHKTIGLSMETDLSYISSLFPENDVLSPGDYTKVSVTVKRDNANNENDNTIHDGYVKVEAISIN